MMTILTSENQYLAGHLLVAMPGMPDPRFAKAVIYVCSHSDEGAMGLVINKAMEDIPLDDLLEQLGVPMSEHAKMISLHMGGPVEQGRGFVLHSPDYVHEGTIVVDDKMALTGTLDILQDIAHGTGPKKSMLVLGYAGWGPGQLDAEILENGWLTVEADPELVFDDDLNAKWQLAIAKLGIDLSLLSEDAGHA
jgi:putative transcriptional regulator